MGSSYIPILGVGVLKLKEILVALPSLSKADLGQIKIRVDGLLGESVSRPTETKSPNLDWLTEGFVYECKRRGVLTGLISPVLVSKLTPTGYAERNAAVRQKLTTNNSMDDLALGRIVAEALASWIDGFAPVSLKIMLNSIDKTLTALDNSFPGYVQSGLIKFLIRRTIPVKQKDQSDAEPAKSSFGSKRIPRRTSNTSKGTEVS